MTKALGYSEKIYSSDACLSSSGRTTEQTVGT
jgi:hypothetical protein